jgi:hypothetical protein
MNRTSFLASAIILSFGLYSSARALTINFDPPSTPGDLPSTLTAMGNSPGSSVPSDAQLSNQYDADGVLFSSSDPFVAVVEIDASSASPPNGIGGVTSDGLLSYADPVNITFVIPGTTTPGVTNNVSIQADSIGIAGQFATLSAFDISGHLLDQQTLEDVGAEVWNLSVAGIHSVQFDFPTTNAGAPTTGSAFGNGTGIALDNLQFGSVTAADGSPPTGNPPAGNPSAIPLPPALGSALITLGLLAALRLFRRQAPAL